MTDDLNWSSHYDYLCSRAYRTLGLLQRTFSFSLPVHANKQLYIALVRSQLSYCSPLWRPYLIKDITSLERIQRRATKFILGNRLAHYKDRLIALKLLPLMYYLELNDLFFSISNIKNPSTNFSVLSYVSFSTGSTRSAAHGKLVHARFSSSLSHFSYFSRLPRLWNFLPAIDLTQSFLTIKSKMKSFFGYFF